MISTLRRSTKDIEDFTQYGVRDSNSISVRLEQLVRAPRFHRYIQLVIQIKRWGLRRGPYGSNSFVGELPYKCLRTANSVQLSTCPLDHRLTVQANHNSIATERCLKRTSNAAASTHHQGRGHRRHALNSTFRPVHSVTVQPQPEGRPNPKVRATPLPTSQVRLGPMR